MGRHGFSSPLCWCLVLIAATAAAESPPLLEPPNDGQRSGQQRERRIPPDAFLSISEGQVLLQPVQDVEWVQGDRFLPIQVGDRLATGQESRTEIRAAAGVTVRLGESSKLDWNRYRREEGDLQFSLRLVHGLLQVSSLPRSGILSTEVTVLLGPYRLSLQGPVQVRVEAEAPDRFRLRLDLGGLRVEQGDQVLELHEGETLEMDGAGRLGPPVRGRTPEDAFDAWCRALDRGSEHSPEGAPYEEDLEAHGEWVEHDDYGRGWRPHVAAGWSPYSCGYWYWYSPYGWYWVSCDPWGYWPYRYGTWVWTERWGWVWIPGPWWGPCWVWWTYDEQHVYWVARHPEDEQLVVQESATPGNARIIEAKGVQWQPLVEFRASPASPVDAATRPAQAAPEWVVPAGSENRDPRPGKYEPHWREAPVRPQRGTAPIRRPASKSPLRPSSPAQAPEEESPGPIGKRRPPPS